MSFSRPLYNVEPGRAAKQLDPLHSGCIMADYGYGRTGVRIFEADRNNPRHTAKECEVSVFMRLNSHDEYYKGDNSKVIGSDVAENSVYVHAQKYGLQTPEEFALSLTQFLMDTYRSLEMCNVQIQAPQWQRLGEHENQGYYKDNAHNHAFMLNENGIRTCEVVRKRDDAQPLVLSGILNLRLLKTGATSFVGYAQNALNTDGNDENLVHRMDVDVKWQYKTIEGIDFLNSWYRAREVVLKSFAGDPTSGIHLTSTQYFTYITEPALLDAIPEICSVLVKAQKFLYSPYDFSKFPLSEKKSNVAICLPLEKSSSLVCTRTDCYQVTNGFSTKDYSHLGNGETIKNCSHKENGESIEDSYL